MYMEIIKDSIGIHVFKTITRSATSAVLPKQMSDSLNLL